MPLDEEENSSKFFLRFPFFKTNDGSNNDHSFINFTTCFLLILVFVFILYFKKRIKKKVARRWNRSKRFLLRTRHTISKYFFNKAGSNGSSTGSSNSSESGPFKFVIHSQKITSGDEEAEQVIVDENDSSTDSDEWDDMESDEEGGGVDHFEDEMMDELKSAVDPNLGGLSSSSAPRSSSSSVTNFGGRKKRLLNTRDRIPIDDRKSFSNPSSNGEEGSATVLGGRSIFSQKLLQHPKNASLSHETTSLPTSGSSMTASKVP